MILGLLLIVFTSVFTGLLSGLLGIGGNLVAIPALVYIFTAIMHFSANNSMHLAIGTCLLVMVSTTFASAKEHYKNGNIDFGIYKQLWPMMVLGDILGAMSASLIHGLILEKIFGAFLFFVSYEILFRSKIANAASATKTLPKLIMNLLSFVIGFKSGLLGIGGGTMLIPLLLYLNYSSHKTIATTALCSFTMAVVGALTFIILGHSHNLGITYSVGFIYLPAVVIMMPITFISAKIGVKLTQRISHENLKKCFGILLIFLGIRMLFF